MIIRKIETWILERRIELFDSKRMGRAPMDWSQVLLKMTTDSGVEGIASFWASRSQGVTDSYIHDTIAPVVLGRCVHDREAIWHELWNLDRHGCFFPVFLPGPIDVALYDCASQAAGLPLYKYLGAYRDKLPVYASSLFHSEIDDYVSEAKRYADRGIHAYKAHEPGPWRFDMEIQQALREALGPKAVLMSDPVAEYSLDEAIRVGRGLEQLDYHWFEEPFRDHELYKYTELCRVLDIPVAATETARGGHYSIAQFIHQRAADIVRADVSWKWGVTGTMKVAHLAEAFGMRCEIHTTTMGPMEIANLHVSCAIRNCEYFELFAPDDVFRFPLKEPLPIDSNGMIHAPQKPGLGVELDWDAIDNACVGQRVSEFKE